MNARNTRTAPPRSPAVPMHRGPQAQAAAPSGGTPYQHAPNAALLIDFDNVTMGIRSDLGVELRNLLSSDVIKGKVAVQRAYADWRRYPQYIVPLAEASIDHIFAVAYGSSKKNATDIRLAIDAMELVFTRPEIGTFILLSGDSDFSSLVLKLKEYGKYVIGVGIRESSSDLLVQNCDEYYSYNALAGLMKASDDETRKYDPWELVAEAVSRMKRNGDVMRADRLKQVMQDIDPSFDEKNLGMAKFSRFVQEAAQRGLLTLSRLENGQMEVRPLEAAVDETATAAVGDASDAQRRAAGESLRTGQGTDQRAERTREVPLEGNGRRGRRGRGRGRADRREPRPTESEVGETFAPPPAPPRSEVPTSPGAADDTDVSGERLTRDEAFDLIRRSVAALTHAGVGSVLASEVRRKAYELLGRGSESLTARNFDRILRDAHDSNVIDLRKRGDDYEVSSAVVAEPIAAQMVTEVGAETSQAARSAANAAALRRGIRFRGVGRGGRAAEPPPELLAVGVVDLQPSAPPTAALVPGAGDAATDVESVPAPAPAADGSVRDEGKPATKSGRARGGRTSAAKPRGRKTAARKSAQSAAAASTEGSAGDSGSADRAADEGSTSQGPARSRPRRSSSRKKSASPAGSDG